MIEYVVGIDGGGSGTRAMLARSVGPTLGRGEAGPSPLAQGTTAAWHEIERATVAAFESAGLRAPSDWSACALGAGLSGATHAPWRAALIAANPGFATLAVDTDAFVMLLGAHAGGPGTIIAAGTGSVGEVLRRDGSRGGVGGWGFPVGDEGSGAWLGLRAMALAQSALDGRAPPGALARLVWRHCGADREALLAWCGAAGQAAYARLAPAVFEAESEDPTAARLLARAAASLEAMACVLDPHGELPLAVSGSVARRLSSRLGPTWRSRCVEPAAEPASGALTLIRRALDSPPARTT